MGARVKHHREKRGWTQEELAKRASLHRVSVGMIEAGMRKNPTVLTRKKLAKALGVDIMELLD